MNGAAMRPGRLAMKHLFGFAIAIAICAMLLASSSCSVQPPKEEKPEQAFCHSDSECEPPRVCNKELGHWRPVNAPADAGVCIEAAVASCPKGYVLSGGLDPRTGTNTSFCAAGPSYCHSDQDCQLPFRCDKHTETFIPGSAGAGAGVCMAGQ
jgi:hypothetical protein